MKVYVAHLFTFYDGRPRAAVLGVYPTREAAAAAVEELATVDVEEGEERHEVHEGKDDDGDQLWWVDVGDDHPLFAQVAELDYTPA